MLRYTVMLVATLTATAALADQAAPAADPMANNASALAPAGDVVSQVAFAYADRNEDIMVSWEEYRNRAMRVFGKADSNGDGILQVTELRALAGPGAPTAPFDIGIATFNAGLRKHFDDADKNRDGALTPAEWRDAVRPSTIY